MFAIAINYRNAPLAASPCHPAAAAMEWPPHPDRVFVALVAAWSETGQDAAGERALRWLEGQPPPALAVSAPPARQSEQRYAPPNNAPVIHLIWPDASPSDHLPALRQLAAAVVCIGHPSLLAQAYIAEAPPPANWQPTPAGPGDCRLRVPYAGRLDDLANARRKEPRRAAYRQTAAGPAAAADAKAEADDAAYPQSVFSDRLVIFETTGADLHLPAAGPLAAAFRRLIMAQCPEPIPEWVSGHAPDGARSQGPRIALLPLASVGRAHADGRITGLAIALPRSLPLPEARRGLHNLLGYDADGATRL